MFSFIRRPLALLLATAILVGGPVALAFAEDAKRADRPKRRSNRSGMMVVLRIADALDLDEEQALRFATKFRSYNSDRKNLLAKKKVLHTELAAALDSEPLDEADLTRRTEELAKVESELVNLPDRLFREVGPMLSVEQRARLLIVRDRLSRQLDEERRRRRAERRAEKRRNE